MWHVITSHVKTDHLQVILSPSIKPNLANVNPYSIHTIMVLIENTNSLSSWSSWVCYGILTGAVKDGSDLYIKVTTDGYLHYKSSNARPSGDNALKNNVSSLILSPLVIKGKYFYWVLMAKPSSQHKRNHFTAWGNHQAFVVSITFKFKLTCFIFFRPCRLILHPLVKCLDILE